MQADHQLPFEAGEYEARIALLQAAMAAENYDALVCFAPSSLYYYCGYEGYSYNEEQFMLVLPDRPAAMLVIRDIDESLAKGPARYSHCSEIITYRYPVEDPSSILWKLLGGARAAKRVGIEAGAPCLSALFLQRIRDDAPENIGLRDATGVIAAPRFQKRPAEWRYIREAAAIGDGVLQRCTEKIAPGMTEIDFAGEVEYQLRRAGSEDSSSPTLVESGPRTVAAHSTPTRRPIQRGEPVRFAFAAVRRRYHVTTYQPMHLGEPGADYARYVRGCQEAFDVLLDSVGPGQSIKRACEKSRAVLQSHRMAECNMGRYGYGVGIAFPPGWSEPYSLNEYSGKVFVPGMTFCLHITMSVPQHAFGFTLGANYAITEAGVERTNRAVPGLRVL